MFIQKPLTPGMGTVRGLVAGVGINDANYVTGYSDKSGKKLTCPYYSTWAGMLERVYSEKFHDRYPSYRGCSLDPSWKLFSVFREWMAKQDWEGKALDKDLLVPGNRQYGPDKCIFVSRDINSLTAIRGNGRGSLPLGVTKTGSGKYTYYLAKCSFYGKQKTLGSFKTPEEAAECYRAAKLQHIKEIAHKQTDQRLKAALLNLPF